MQHIPTFKKIQQVYVHYVTEIGQKVDAVGLLDSVVHYQQCRQMKRMQSEARIVLLLNCSLLAANTLGFAVTARR